MVFLGFTDCEVFEDTILPQDAVAVCRDIAKPFLDFSAALVVEVLSSSTTDFFIASFNSYLILLLIH